MSKHLERCTICTYGAPILRKKAAPVIAFNRELAELADEMLQAMYIANGIGLAAPQIGVSKQVIVIDLQLEDSNESIVLDGRMLPIGLMQPFCCINPSFEPINDIQISDNEGCLSLPDVRGNVKRYYEILLNYQDLQGEKHILQCSNLFSRCIQHECDHLKGILFVDRLSKVERKENQELLNEIKALGGTFDYSEEIND